MAAKFEVRVWDVKRFGLPEPHGPASEMTSALYFSEESPKQAPAKNGLGGSLTRALSINRDCKEFLCVF